jgi:signal transduction histidine kinase
MEALGMVAFPAVSAGRGQAARTPVDPSIPGHRRGRPGWLRSVRTQLLLPIVVAASGLVALGAVQTRSATDAASDARRAQVLATTATDTVRLVHEIQREAAETVALRQREGRSGTILVAAQRRRTDAAIARYRASAVRARDTATGLQPTLAPAEAALAGLETARTEALVPTTAANGDKGYRDIAAALLAVADALPSQIQDPDLAGRARSVAAVAAIGFYNAIERDALYAAFAAKKFDPGGLAALAAVFGGREQREAEFLRVAAGDDRDLYTALMQGPDVEKARQMRGSVLSADRSGTALVGDEEVWFIAQSGVVRRANMVGLELSERLDRATARAASAAAQRAIGIGVGSAVLAAGVLLVAALIAERTSRRLRRLRAAALTVARSDLPQTIDAVTTGEAAPAADDPSATSVTLDLAVSQDEVGEVAEAFATVHHTALRLAAEQAEVRVDTARMAETLARRIRTLITRQLRLLDEFERDETDPEALARLFVLDHIAARLRRNGENLLVLAGGEPDRGVTAPVPLGVVAAAAASEIEDFQRIQVSIGPLAVAAPAVGYVVHLLAELLENAAGFSPPELVVHVEAHAIEHGALLCVHDRGIGIAADRLVELNERLGRPGALTSAVAGTMGLNVVAHLAQRHGIRVWLASPGPGQGTIAYVELPRAVMARYEPGPLDSRPTRAAAGSRPALLAALSRQGARRPPGAAWLFVKNAEPHDPAEAPVLTGSGLPRRRPGGTSAAIRSPFPQVSEPAGPMDPDEVRMRLSAFADGVAAAARRTGL